MPDDAGSRPEPVEAVQLTPLKSKARALPKRFWFGVTAVVALAALAFPVSHWFTTGRFEVATENAYVRADTSVISAKIEGYVREVPAAENQMVHAGDVLVRIEPADYEARVAHARAALAQAQGQVASESAGRAQAAADLNRYRPLAQRGILSSAGLDAVEARARQAGGGLAAANASVAAARADLETAELDLERTTIRAPIDGVVGDRQAQVGQLVRAGAPLMAVVPLQDVYVVANFKETQIEHLRAGQPVTIRPDVSHDLRLRGEVQSIAPASGSEFSIIPTDTATGNFTKIVQRVPVRIRILPDQEGAELLRAGLSVSVSVDTRG